MSGTERRFSYARGVAPPMWIMFGLGLIELFVAHLLLSHWWPRVAAVFGLLTMAVLAWLAWTIRSFGRLPVLLSTDRLAMRAGGLKRLTIDPRNVEAVARNWPPGDIGRRDTANLALIAYPNVLVRLREPVAWRGRQVRAVAHKLDDPDAFARAVAEVTLTARA